MNQILFFGNLNAVIEALIFAQKQYLDLEKTIDAVKGGTAGSWQLANLAPRIINRDFRPGFMINLMEKDLRLIKEVAESNKIPLTTTSLIQQMYWSLQASGEGKSGTQALIKAAERLAGVEVRYRK